jgi:U32 family peptidase
MLPELLAPAGTMEKLKIAIHYGADAVYLGGEQFGLRAMAGNFSSDEFPAALDLCHRHGVKAYLTVNSYPDDHQLDQLERYLQRLAPLPFDAYIVADPGVLRMVRRISPQRELHLSTQANTINREAALFWQDQGVSRINLAREMTLDGIRTTAKALTIPCEVFVHGALCIAYSGRCLLSSALTGRSANQGACTQPCRWRYSLQEESRPGVYLPIEEDHHGTFIFNSKDLCLLEQLPELISAGVGALKIEGRMKGVHYLAGVLRVYRTALDAYARDPLHYSTDPAWLEELATVSNRGYTTGFLFGDPRDVGQSYQAGYQRSHQLVGVVESVDPDNGTGLVAVRNRFRTGDLLELIGPAMKQLTFTAGELQLQHPGDDTLSATEVVHPNQRLIMPLPAGAAPDDLLRLPQTDCTLPPEVRPSHG